MSELDTNNSIMQSSLHYLKGQYSGTAPANAELGLTVTEASHGCYLNLRGDANNADFAAGIQTVLGLSRRCREPTTVMALLWPAGWGRMSGCW